MYKLRNIAFQRSGEAVKGLTVPSEVATFFENVSFSVIKSGTSIIYTSGAVHKISEAQVEEYKFEDVKV